MTSRRCRQPPPCPCEGAPAARPSSLSTWIDGSWSLSCRLLPVSTNPARWNITPDRHASYKPEGTCVMTTKRIQPDRLFQRALKGHTLYSHVVIASGKSLVFIAGQLSRDREGRIVGAGDMAAQICQV